jgi:hypothetical protein
MTLAAQGRSQAAGTPLGGREQGAVGQPRGDDCTGAGSG